jgi:hypothetical protein
MRVLTRGRTALLLAVIAGVTAVTLPASAGTTTVSRMPVAHTAVSPAGEGTTGVLLGPAVAYVRLPDGTIRQVR